MGRNRTRLGRMGAGFRLLWLLALVAPLSSCYLSHETAAEVSVSDDGPVHIFWSCMGTQLDHMIRMCADGTGLFLKVYNGEAGELQVTHWESAISNLDERRVFGEGMNRMNLVRDADGVHWLTEPPILPSCGDRSVLIDDASSELQRHVPLLECP